MQAEMWLVACGCGSNEEFEMYAEARRWQDGHESSCDGNTDLWAPELPAEAFVHLAPLAPQALNAARA